ncbi:MAG TPA: SlyX family protein [Lysobacter sp.]|nr:SlyX family protein [Lysobacter sp.]
MQDLEQRLVDLETRLAFQEHAIAQLSDALAEAREENTRTLLALRRVLEELKQVRSTLTGDLFGSDPASEPPPPHY